MKFKPVQTSLTNHQAILAYNKLGQNYGELSSIELLTLNGGKPHNKKSEIYRLSGVGIDGSSVIAKKAPLKSLMNEKFFYENISPFLSIFPIRFYGFVLDEDKKNSWLFLEECRGTRYFEDKEQHRLVVANWLGYFHSTTSKLDNNQLDNHGPEKYYQYINTGKEVLSENLLKPYIKRNDADVLNKLLTSFSIIESNWAEIIRLCDKMPKCVVHGDFIGKNVMINVTDNNNTINVFDWEYVGWGVPAIDLGALDYTIWNLKEKDVTKYTRSVQRVWPNVTEIVVQQWINIGLIFRYLAWISTTSLGLASDYVDEPMYQLKDYSTSLTSVLIQLKWADHLKEVDVK